MLVPRALPTWYGAGQPQLTPSMMAMLSQGQNPQQQPGANFTPTPAPTAPIAEIGPDRASTMRQQMAAEAQQKQYGSRENVNSPLTAGIYALNQGLGSFLDMKAGESKQKQSAADNKALIEALNSADPMSALSQLDSPEAQQAFMQIKLGQMNQKPGERWTDVDTNQDGAPDAQRNSQTGEYKPINNPRSMEDELALRRAGASRTSINTGGGSDKQIFEALGESYKAAEAANTGLNSIREAEAALQGQGIYGQFANERLALQKIGSIFGADPSAITNTETFRAAIAPNIAAIMKATVGSTQISNADRDFAEKAAGGAITLDKTSIQRLLSIARRASEGVVQRHNQRLNSVYPDNGRFQRERALFGVQAPTQEDAPDWAQ